MRYLVALSLASLCLATLAAGLAIEAGAMLVGVAVVAGVLSLVVLADATLKRRQATRSPPAAG